MAVQLLTNSISLKQKQTEAVNLLQSWIDDEDESEQQETGQYLIHALDKDRLSDRKLFPLDMKAIWSSIAVEKACADLTERQNQELVLLLSSKALEDKALKTNLLQALRNPGFYLILLKYFCTILFISFYRLLINCLKPFSFR
jgi:hypothetical protein